MAVGFRIAGDADEGHRRRKAHATVGRLGRHWMGWRLRRLGKRLVRSHSKTQHDRRKESLLRIEKSGSFFASENSPGIRPRQFPAIPYEHVIVSFTTPPHEKPSKETSPTDNEGASGSVFTFGECKSNEKKSFQWFHLTNPSRPGKESDERRVNGFHFHSQREIAFAGGAGSRDSETRSPADRSSRSLL
ncbi:unnamed protein product [Darwinula stevensoni]|uniref:Uncharacterized protein n=1 Tax=Darwinula stevensoni TaxID=69355 RepID=A0A7R9AG63_9CRUS|nr:unnamed protein product [Darwinula stevensoni]CAG0903517.1 unnamed protein product [Darwinula stevensoni]